MSRVPLRLRLTAGFVAAMVMVLAAVGAFAYLRVRAGLDETVNEALHARAGPVLRLVAQGQKPVPDSIAEAEETEDVNEERPGRPEDPSEDEPEPASAQDRGDDENDDSFVQVLSLDGLVGAATSNVPRSTLGPAELRRAAAGPLLLERRMAEIEGPVRILAQPAPSPRGRRVAIVGQSIDDRYDTLAALLTAFAVGGPIAVLLAALLGYGLAAAGLRPVEAMRRRAADVSLERDGRRLPLPQAHDEVRRLGETLNQMLDRLQASFERERRFVGDASHELRTPIAVVKTELETALRAGGDDLRPAAREALVAAVEEADSMAQLAEDLLVLARAAEGRLPVRPERVDLRAAVQSVQRRFEDRAAEHGRVITVTAAAGLHVPADPLRLRQALGNLVDNALRHGRGEITVTAQALDGGVQIVVGDEGDGFAPEIATHAFERFSRADGARTRGGAGLGLAIVLAIAEAHGGSARIVRPGSVGLWLPGPGAETAPHAAPESGRERDSGRDRPGPRERSDGLHGRLRSSSS